MAQDSVELIKAIETILQLQNIIQNKESKINTLTEQVKQKQENTTYNSVRTFVVQNFIISNVTTHAQNLCASIDLALSHFGTKINYELFAGNCGNIGMSKKW